MIQQVGHAKVWPWRSRAARERVDLKDTPTTRWFMDGDLACAGLLSLASGVRIKGVYVDPAFRGQGIGTRLTEHLIDLATLEGCGYVDAYAWNAKWYTERGFISIGKNAHGAQLLRKTLSNNPPNPLPES